MVEPFLHSLLEQPELSPQDPVAEPASLGGDFQTLRLAPCSGPLAHPSFFLFSWLPPLPPPAPAPALLSPFLEMPLFYHSLLFSPSCLVLWGHCWVTVGSPSASCGQRAETLMVEALEDWLGTPPTPRASSLCCQSGSSAPCPSGKMTTWGTRCLLVGVEDAGGPWRCWQGWQAVTREWLEAGTGGP